MTKKFELDEWKRDWSIKRKKIVNNKNACCLKRSYNLTYYFSIFYLKSEIPVVVGFTANGEDNTTIIVDENSNVSLSCEATGKPTPDMVLISGANSRELKRLPQSDSQSTKRRANIYFFLQSISCQDSGGYRCQAHNSAGHSSRILFILAPCKYSYHNFQKKI